MVVLSDLLLGTSLTHDHIYDVFVSFRGLDTRYSFTDHLHRALIDANLRIFLDDEEIETGEHLKPELERAIKSSRASIVVLSQNYAASRWCLDELALILKQRLKSDHIVIPIFYHVEPTDVRKQKNSCGDAMAKHEQRIEAEIDVEKKSQLVQKIDQWKYALAEVADLKGWDAKGRRETEFIDEIVTNIYHSLGVPLRKNLPLLFGMENSIEFITSWLKDKSSHTVDILTILGMGGIGKTSLAKYVHGTHCHLFKRSSFIESISEKWGVVNGRLDLQKQLWGDISKTSQIQVHDSLAYTSMIENTLTRTKMFIVLDDIDSADQLHALLGNKGFHPGSKIIITAKDASLTEKYAPISPIAQPTHMKHVLGGLHKNASLQLLSHHAFMSNSPKKGYEEVSEKLIAYCEGHPLALRVLGESLFNKTVAEWEDCIIGLMEEPDSRIKKALQMSFYSIPSNNDKELFKHIACFFVQKDRFFAETILNSCHIRTLQGIRNLIDRCLLTIGQGNSLMMHQLLQEMGRDVVRQESLDKPEERSRLWHHEESFSVLDENKGTRNIKGLILNMKMLEIEKLCGSVVLETCALSKMCNLMLLHLNFVQLNGSYKNFPQKLRWLCMHGFPLKSIPLDLPMENLVALDMSYSNIESFDMSCSNLKRAGTRQKVTGSCSKERRLLGSLKFLTLSFCELLVSLGGFHELPIVERLIVRQCIGLINVCESIDGCAELVHIDLSYCKKLEKLPRTIGRLKKVKTLLLDGCNFRELPIKTRDMDSPRMLKVISTGTKSQTFLSAIVEAVPNDLEFFEVSIPSSLVRLSFAYNNLSNESFPMNFSCLSMLRELCLDGNPIVSLPDCVRTLPMLEILGMNNCLMLSSVEHPPRTLRQLNLYYNCLKTDYKNLLRKILFDPEMAPLKLIADKNILAPSSFEIEGMIKIQPLAAVDEKVLHRLGWKYFKFFRDRSMVTTYNYRGPEESQIQLYYEFGIFSTIYVAYPRFNHFDCARRGPSISFTIPSSRRKLRGLNFFYVGKFSELPNIKISNITKNRIWIYNHFIQSLNDGIECSTFLSHWMFGMNEMEDGDQITITPEKCSRHSIIDCRVSFVYDDGILEEEEEDALDYYKSWNHIIGGDLSPFQLITGEYFLSSTEFLRSLYPDFSNAHYKEKTISFRAFSPKNSDILGRAPEVRAPKQFWNPSSSNLHVARRSSTLLAGPPPRSSDLDASLWTSTPTTMTALIEHALNSRHLLPKRRYPFEHSTKRTPPSLVDHEIFAINQLVPDEVKGTGYSLFKC